MSHMWRMRAEKQRTKCISLCGYMCVCKNRLATASTHRLNSSFHICMYMHSHKYIVHMPISMLLRLLLLVVCVCPKRCAKIRLTWNELKCNNNGVAQMKLLDMNKRSFLAHTQTRIHTRANAWRQRSKQRCQASDHMRTQGKKTRQQRGGMQCAHIWLLSWCHLRHETTTTITTNNSESACWCCGGSGLRYSEFALCFVCAYQERKCKQCMNMCIYVCIFTRSGEKTGECRIFSNSTHTHQKKNGIHEIFWTDFRFGNVTVMNVDLISVEWRCLCARKKVPSWKHRKKSHFKWNLQLGY